MPQAIGFRLFLVLAIAAWMPATARAQRSGNRPNPEVMVRHMDRDGDGRIAKDEFRGPPQRFSVLDLNGDGFLTVGELQRARGPGGGAPMPKVAASPVAAWYAKLPVLLAHTHFVVRTAAGRDGYDDWDGAEADALRRMDANNVRAAVIEPTPHAESQGEGDTLFQGMLRIARRHPDRFRASGGGATLNGMIGAIRPDRVDAADRRDFTERAEEIVAAGAVSFGEFAAMHFSFFAGHPFEERRPDHALFMTLADIAAKHDMPIDFHMEAVTRDQELPAEVRKFAGHNAERVHANIAAFERLLDHNRKAKIIWLHVGMDSTGDRTVALTRRLLRAHPNLYLTITGFQRAVKDWFILPGRGLNPKWRALILEFPDRFMIGSDEFFQPKTVWHRFPDKLPTALRIVRVPFLPPAVARKIAFENAERLLGWTPIRPEDVLLPVPTAGAPHQSPLAHPVAAASPAAGEMIGPHGVTARQVIAHNDGDGDRRISRGEFPGSARVFDSIDADGDGFLTRDEFEAHWRALRRR